MVVTELRFEILEVFAAVYVVIHVVNMSNFRIAGRDVRSRSGMSMFRFEYGRR